MPKHNLQHVNHPFNAPPQEGDIATEKYKGPSAKVAAAGQGFLEHFFFAISGLVGAGTLAFIFHQPAAKIVQGARKLGTRLKEWSPEGNGVINRSKDTLTNWMGGALHVAFGDVEAAESIASLSANSNHKHAEWLANVAHDKRQGFGNAFLSHTFGLLPWVGMNFKKMLRGLDDRKSTAIAFGGAAGVVGYVGGWAKALFQGGKHGNAGKRQFERAQEEIKHLREVNEDLEKINDRMHQEVVDEATKFKDTAEQAPAQKPHPEHHEKAKPVHAEHASPHEAKKEHTHTPEHASHHADKPQTHTHAHAHQGTLGHHTHAPAMA